VTQFGKRERGRRTKERRTSEERKEELVRYNYPERDKSRRN
jgi:hypothetical protein